MKELEQQIELEEQQDSDNSAWIADYNPEAHQEIDTKILLDEGVTSWILNPDKAALDKIRQAIEQEGGLEMLKKRTR